MADIRCPNMNHGRTNAPIRHCPNCGELLNAAIRKGCDDAKHKILRRDRSIFCHDCGKKLSTLP